MTISFSSFATNSLMVAKVMNIPNKKKHKKNHPNRLSKQKAIAITSRISQPHNFPLGDVTKTS